MEGEVDEAREGILDILEARFGVVPELMVQQIREIQELAVLKVLRRRSAKAATLDEIEELLKKTMG